jgi:V/A-type H+/Na+-transporting ATPase subunit C
MADFDYGNARLHAMKAKLLSHRQLEDLAGMDSLPGMISALMKTAYQPSVEFSITRTTGIETIFQALRQDMLLTIRKTRSFFRHESGEMVLWILRSYDIHNLKAVLRGLGKHVNPVEILSSLLPVGDLDEPTLVELSRAATPRDAADMLASMNLPFARPLLRLRAEHPGADTIEMEIALERWYYKEVSLNLNDGEGGAILAGRSGEIFYEALAMEADITNLITILRFIHTPAERKILRERISGSISMGSDAIHLPSEADSIRLLLVGPGNIPFALLERLSNQDDMASALKLLDGTAYAPSLDVGLQAYRLSGRLSDLEKQLRRYRLSWLARQISSDPLGIGVFLGYLALKINEINNLRWIAQGIQAGLKPEGILGEMEFYP